MSIVYRFFIFPVLLACFICGHAYGSTIHLFLKPAPHEVQQDVEAQLAKEGVKPPVDGLQNLLPKVGGFIALYGGYVDYSDKDGNLTFPLLQKEKKLYIVITPKVDLTFIHGKTISHKNLVKDLPVKQYYLAKKIDENRSSYWEVQEEPAPTTQQISSLAIVILTDPKNLVVPIGKFIATQQTNFILPHIYVVGNTNNTKTSLDFLDLRRFFEQVERNTKTIPEKGAQELIMNN